MEVPFLYNFDTYDSSTLKMEVAGFCETLVPAYLFTWHVCQTTVSQKVEFCVYSLFWQVVIQE